MRSGAFGHGEEEEDPRLPQSPPCASQRSEEVPRRSRRPSSSPSFPVSPSCSAQISSCPSATPPRHLIRRGKRANQSAGTLADFVFSGKQGGKGIRQHINSLSLLSLESIGGSTRLIQCSSPRQISQHSIVPPSPSHIHSRAHIGLFKVVALRSMEVDILYGVEAVTSEQSVGEMVSGAVIDASGADVRLKSEYKIWSLFLVQSF